MLHNKNTLFHALLAYHILQRKRVFLCLPLTVSVTSKAQRAYTLTRRAHSIHTTDLSVCSITKITTIEIPFAHICRCVCILLLRFVCFDLYEHFCAYQCNFKAIYKNMCVLACINPTNNCILFTHFIIKKKTY